MRRLPGMNRGSRIAALALALTLGVSAAPAFAQDQNIPLPIDSVEYLLSRAPFTLPDTLVGTRFAGDRTQRVPLFFPDGAAVLVKWAQAPRGGEEFNNNPRYEIAAYELQKLFLDHADYVVPPTIPRMLPEAWYQTVADNVVPTFRVGQSVMVVLQFFLYSVTADDVWDEKRFETDSVYARHWADANLLTYLIDHKDQNKGNLLISRYPENPRVFSVDNGVAFRSRRSDRGSRWSRLQVKRFAHATVDRLRALSREDLQQALGVMAQYKLQGDQLVPTEPTENWDPNSGIRQRDDGVQIGLTEAEIGDVWNRIGDFLENVDEGKLKVF